MPRELLLLSQGERPASVFFRGGIVRIDGTMNGMNAL
jgi:hypothetical protein